MTTKVNYYTFDSSGKLSNYQKSGSCLDTMEKLKDLKEVPEIEVLTVAAVVFKNVYQKIDKETESWSYPFLYSFFIWIQERNPYSKLFKIREIFSAILEKYGQNEPEIDYFLKSVGRSSSKEFLKKAADLFSTHDDEFKDQTIYDLGDSNSPQLPLSVFKLKNLQIFKAKSLSPQIHELLISSFPHLMEIQCGSLVSRKEDGEWVNYRLKTQTIEIQVGVEPS